MDNKIKRVISAAVMIPIVIVFTMLGGTPFKVFVSVITLIAIFEYRNSYNCTGQKAILGILLLGYTLNLFIIFSNKYNYQLPLIFLILLLSMATPIFNRKYDVISSAVTITGYLYIVQFFTFLILIRDIDMGKDYIWLVFIIAWFCDTCAYYSGRFFGKKKLCPDISPKKTIAGSIGGTLGSIIGVILWNYINISKGISFISIILLGFVGGIIAQIGDLSASLIKRYSGIKDYGNIMPGHGGILDRFDSILFTAPIVYYYIILFIG